MANSAVSTHLLLFTIFTAQTYMCFQNKSWTWIFGGNPRVNMVKKGTIFAKLQSNCIHSMHSFLFAGPLDLIWIWHQACCIGNNFKQFCSRSHMLLKVMIETWEIPFMCTVCDANIFQCSLSVLYSWLYLSTYYLVFLVVLYCKFLNASYTWQLNQLLSTWNSLYRISKKLSSI